MKKHPAALIAAICIWLLLQFSVQAADIKHAIPDSSSAISKSDKPLLNKAKPYIISLAIGGALFAVDKDIQRESLRSSIRGADADKFFHTVEHFGTQGPYLITMGIQAGYGLIFRSRQSFINAGELAGGLIIAQAVTKGIKTIAGRKRPYESDSPYKFFKGGESFYSGHTVTAFTYATIMAKCYPRQDLSFIAIESELPLMPILMYSAAGLIGIQRIYKNVHWASDTYFGGLAGYGFGSLSVYLGKRFEKNGFHITYINKSMIEYCISF